MSVHGVHIVFSTTGFRGGGKPCHGRDYPRCKDAEKTLGVQFAPSFRHTQISDGFAHEALKLYTKCRQYVFRNLKLSIYAEYGSNYAWRKDKPTFRSMSYSLPISASRVSNVRKRRRFTSCTWRNACLMTRLSYPLNQGVENTNTLRYNTRCAPYTHWHWRILKPDAQDHCSYKRHTEPYKHKYEANKKEGRQWNATLESFIVQ